MDLEKAFLKVARKIKPLRIIVEVSEKLMDDTPVSHAWVKDITNHYQRFKPLYNKLNTFEPMMGLMLWRASCNGYNDIITDLSSKYSDAESVQEIAGQSYWCAATDGNLDGMKILMNNLGSYIKDEDITSALCRASYQNNLEIINHILDNFDDRLNKSSIEEGLSASVCFASNRVLEHLLQRKGHVLDKNSFLQIQKTLNSQSELYTRSTTEGKKMNFSKSQELLDSYKEVILKPINTNKTKFRPKI